MAFSGSGSGTESDPYQITTWAQLQEISNDLDKYFILKNDLSSSTTGYSTYASSTANSGSGWLPLGDSSTKFTGTFDGNDYTISNLYINRSSTNYIGLFGYTSGFTPGSTIKNIGVVSCNITGDGQVGALVGKNYSAITNCYSTGSVSGNSFYIGGLTGRTSNSISNSYSTCSVSSDHSYTGGFSGGYNSTITNCYSTGSVSSGGEDDTGGFVGGSTGSSSEITSCFWDTTTSGTTTSAGGTGKTTTQMKDLSTFSAWSIIGVTSKADGYANPSYTWNIVDDSTYPFLSWEYTAATYTLTTSATNGSISKSPDTSTYTSGTSVTLTATANSGYSFSNWSGDLTGSTNPDSLSMTANKNVTAVFEENTVNKTISNIQSITGVQSITI